MMLTEQLAVVLGPVLLGAVLGPLLIAMMDTAKRRAEAENYEQLSDKTRFEAMDLLVTHLREELERLRREAGTTRELVTLLQTRITELEIELGLPRPP